MTSTKTKKQCNCSRNRSNTSPANVANTFAEKERIANQPEQAHRQDADHPDKPYPHRRDQGFRHEQSERDQWSERSQWRQQQ